MYGNILASPTGAGVEGGSGPIQGPREHSSTSTTLVRLGKVGNKKVQLAILPKPPNAA